MVDEHVVYVDEVADTLLRQVRGLMFRRKPITIYFSFKRTNIYPIHSWFVFFPFDLVYLLGNRVVEVYPNVLPFSYIKPKHPSDGFIELPSGYIHEHSISVGDRVVFRYR